MADALLHGFHARHAPHPHNGPLVIEVIVQAHVIDTPVLEIPHQMALEAERVDFAAPALKAAVLRQPGAVMPGPRFAVKAHAGLLRWGIEQVERDARPACTSWPWHAADSPTA